MSNVTPVLGEIERAVAAGVRAALHGVVPPVTLPATPLTATTPQDNLNPQAHIHITENRWAYLHFKRGH